LQNLKLRGGFEPQFGQITSNSSEDPHSPQNMESSGFSNWHFGHFIGYALQIKRKVEVTDKRTGNSLLIGLSISEIL
jgi:hypothetical protein